MGEAEARLFAAEGAKVIAAALPERPALLGSRLNFIARDNRGESSGLSEARGHSLARRLGYR